MTSRAVELAETDAQHVLLVLAFEQADESGRWLTHDERERAGEQARAEAGDDAARLLARRAELLLPVLEARVPQLQRLLRAGRLRSGFLPLCVLGALVVGVLGNALGPDGRVNILFAPMLGLVLWNLCVYLALVLWIGRAALARLRGDDDVRASDAGAHAHGSERAQASERATDRDARTRRATSATGDGDSLLSDVLSLLARGGSLLRRAAEWLLERSLGRARARSVDDQALLGAALTRYMASWRVAGGALLAGRLRRLLHLGAAALVVGAVLGMYVRGLGLQYRVGWESTFLGPESVAAVLRAFLGPAAALLGWTLPDAGQLAALRFDAAAAPAAEQAARFIHLYALTGVLFVLAPRTLLAAIDTALTRKLALRVPIAVDAGVLRRLVSPARRGAHAVVVHGYGWHLPPRAGDELSALLHDVFGTRAALSMASSLEYGDDPPPVRGAASAGDDASRDDAPACDVFVFALAQSPESEVHGAFLREARRVRAGRAAMLVLVDGGSYRKRLGDDSPRLAERRRAWDRVLREAGVEAAHVDLSRPADEATASAVSAAVMPAGDAS
ncbi:MAG: DUF2868 domain-containing protein [Planctomycetes bacterium]|nr:DUF2868 domain-containing protein [Planctomycetota bacterium]